jgi:hypothetical protein
VGGRFENTRELKVMTYNKAIKGPDGDHWKAEVDNEYNCMVKNKVFEAVFKKDLPPGGYRQCLGDEKEKQWNSVWEVECTRV